MDAKIPSDQSIIYYDKNNVQIINLLIILVYHLIDVIIIYFH